MSAVTTPDLPFFLLVNQSWSSLTPPYTQSIVKYCQFFNNNMSCFYFLLFTWSAVLLGPTTACCPVLSPFSLHHFYSILSFWSTDSMYHFSAPNFQWLLITLEIIGIQGSSWSCPYLHSQHCLPQLSYKYLTFYPNLLPHKQLSCFSDPVPLVIWFLLPIPPFLVAKIPASLWSPSEIAFALT